MSFELLFRLFGVSFIGLFIGWSLLRSFGNPPKEKEIYRTYLIVTIAFLSVFVFLKESFAKFAISRGLITTTSIPCSFKNEKRFK